MKTKYCLLLLLCASHFAAAQIPRLQANMATLAGISVEFWKAKDDKITQFSFPITYIYPVNDRLRFDIMTSPALANLSSGASYSLSGMSDSRIRGHYLFGSDNLLLSFGVNLPTGKSALTTEEFNVANALTIHALDFRVPSLGQGLDMTVGLATAREIGSFIVGGGVSYLRKGTFKPFKGTAFEYDPGDEFVISTGFDRKISFWGKESRLLADAMYTLYTNDAGNGKTIFKSGNKLVLQVGSFIPLNKYQLLVYLRDRLKAKNKTGVGDVFAEERKNRNGNELELESQLLFPYANGQRWSATCEMKFFSNNEYDTGGATVFGLGGGLLKRFSPQLYLDTSLRVYLGTITSSKEAVGLTGVKLSGGLRYFFK